MKKTSLRFINRMVLLITIIMAVGCASAPTGPIHLYPVDPGHGAGNEVDNDGKDEYSVTSQIANFKNNFVRVSVRHVDDPGEIPAGILTRLLEREYVILSLEVENLSTNMRVVYKPSYTVLRTNTLDYWKPLDYTDLYSIANEIADFETISSLRAVKGRFYDLDISMTPGQKASRFLIFPIVSKRSSKATLEIKNLYVGGNPFDIAFAFSVKTLESPDGQ